MKRRTNALGLLPFFLLVATTAFGADTLKGMIISRAGDTLTMKSDSGNTIVLLTDETVTKDDRGLFGIDEKMSHVVLIPGLKLEVEGTTDSQGQLVAKTITVDGDDLETSQLIQAGVHPTAEQVRANQKLIAENKAGVSANAQDIARINQALGSSQQEIEAHKRKIEQSIKEIEEATTRFLALSDYDVFKQATVKFDVGSSKISAEDQQQLKEFSKNAQTKTGYLVEITGYTDSTGKAEVNQKLSEDRAKAVINYLIQQCGVPVRRILAPGSMGIYQPSATNETKEGRAENRRVEIKVLARKGVAG